jgi:flagellar protein FliO/FliZ
MSTDVGSILNPDIYYKFIFALAVVVGLIIIVAFLAKRFGLGGRLAATGGRKRRLAIVEVLPLDAKRRLVLVRRDAVEHLVLIGPESDVVVERGANPPAAAPPDFAAALPGARP